MSDEIAVNLLLNRDHTFVSPFFIYGQYDYGRIMSVGGIEVRIDDHLVQDAKTTVKRHEKAGTHTHYLTFNPGADTQDITGHSETRVISVRLPDGATNVSLQGPGHFNKRGKGKIYGVRITFAEETKGKKAERSRIIELPSPAIDVQLLDRKPDEAYKAVA